MTLVTRVVAQIPYAAYDRVTRMVADAGGKVTDQLFAEDVQLTLAFVAGTEQPFLDALREYANGEQLARASEPAFAEF
jgi:putative IMPACT (imprinted ancient) family translation regulator